MTPESPTPEWMCDRALDLLSEGEPAQAAALLRRCLEADPGMLEAMHALIRALSECGEVDQAMAVARRLAEIDPEEALAHTSLSILYRNQGRIAEAEAEALKAKLLEWKRQLRTS